MLQYEFNIHVEHYLVAIEDTNLPQNVNTQPKYLIVRSKYSFQEQ